MKQLARYTVYDNNTDFPVIVCGTAKECAKIMEIKLNSFHHLLASNDHGNRWLIIKEGRLSEREVTK